MMIAFPPALTRSATATRTSWVIYRAAFATQSG